MFFADDAYVTADEHSDNESPAAIRQRLEDGTSFRAIKVQHEPAALGRRLADLG